MVKRNIGVVSYAIDENKANEIFFDSITASEIKDYGIGGILSTVYRLNGNEYMPLSLMIEMTNGCNFSCPFCYINESYIIHKQIPEFNIIKKDLDYLIENGLIYCILSGGECLTYPNFNQLYVYLKENGVMVTVFTNGYLINDKLIELFDTYKPFKIEVSIYGTDDISYKETTNTTNVKAEIVFDNILKLKEKGINVVAKTPINCYTEKTYKEIEKWCVENKIEFYTGAEMLKTYTGKSTERYKASSEILNYITDKNTFEFFNNDEKMKLANGKVQQKKAFDCTAGWYDIFITPDYTLHPCMKAVSIDEWSFKIQPGKLKETLSQMKQKILFEKGKSLTYCNGCKHSEVCQECFMTQYSYNNVKNQRKEYCQKLKNYMLKQKYYGKKTRL